MAIHHDFDDSDSSVIHGTGRGFLGNLTHDAIPSYPYRGREQFLRDYDDNPIWDKSECFILTGVTQQVFNTVFDDAESGACSAWSSYDTELQLLLVEMTSTTHSIASRTFNMILMDAIEPMGMKRSLCQLGDAKYKADIGGKQPDEAWRPRRVPRELSGTWPSVVLEVALSETKAKLQRDIRFWHHASEGGVKVVLTLCIDRSRPEIVIEQWEANGISRCERTQRIVMSKTRRGTLITGGPLIIDFAKLFLRQPNLPREQDINIDGAELEELASCVWEEQGFN